MKEDLGISILLMAVEKSIGNEFVFRGISDLSMSQFLRLSGTRVLSSKNLILTVRGKTIGNVWWFDRDIAVGIDARLCQGIEPVIR